MKKKKKSRREGRLTRKGENSEVKMKGHTERGRRSQRERRWDDAWRHRWREDGGKKRRLGKIKEQWKSGLEG